jgi:hypothetical protein
MLEVVHYCAEHRCKKVSNQNRSRPGEPTKSHQCECHIARALAALGQHAPGQIVSSLTQLLFDSLIPLRRMAANSSLCASNTSQCVSNSCAGQGNEMAGRDACKNGLQCCGT